VPLDEVNTLKLSGHAHQSRDSHPLPGVSWPVVGRHLRGIASPATPCRSVIADPRDPL